MGKGKRSPPRTEGEIIDCGLELIGRRLRRALNDECELDKLVELVRDTELSGTEKNEIVQMLKKLELPDIKVIASIVETVRKNSAQDNAECAEGFEIKLPEGADEYAK